MQIRVEDPSSPEVLALLGEHLADMFATSPPESVHALDPEALRHPSITFWAARDDNGALLGVGALKHHAGTDGSPGELGELKSMRTSAEARGRGVASAVLGAIIAECQARGIRELALETGVEPYFEPARTLYRKLGFRSRGPFADYTDDPNSVYFALAIPSGATRPAFTA